MLQPRLSGCAIALRVSHCALIMRGLVLAVLLSALVACEEINENEFIEAARIKREDNSDSRDLTVLLVNDQNRNDYNTKIGRYHSVKPLIGLLTSTARTFIQDGVTTEFATQILGTTLDNGRIYAQLLTKSSLVLYSKPTSVDDDPFIVQPTRVHSVFDGKWNVKQNLGIVDPDKFVLKNTDYLEPSSKMEIVYASKSLQDNLRLWNPTSGNENQADDNQILEEPKGRNVDINIGEPKFEVYNYLDGPSVENEKNIDLIRPAFLNTVDSLYRQSKAFDHVTEPIKEVIELGKDVINETNVIKVKANFDLPTFTIKNEFSPIFYYIDNVESRYSPQQPLPQTKLPKKLFGHNTEPKSKTTFTYAGFADFTTVVGDTVIIFTPNTETVRTPNPDEVNVFSVSKPVDNIATKITFLSADIPVATSTFKPYDINSETVFTMPVSDETSSSEKYLFNDEDSLKKVIYNVDDKVADTIQIKYNNGFDLNLDVIQPSEPIYTTESSRNTESLDIGTIPESSSHPTEPLVDVVPTATSIVMQKDSITTESNVKNIFTNSEEETENTAAEVIEKSEEAHENYEEGNIDSDPDLQTTTESGHSDESYEIDTTTENKYNKHEEVFCTDGLETLSTMTTAYKTLTYLTTYFIPLEGTETTTSIKSDVVVESNVGYLTNVLCRTNMLIESTSVLSNVYANTISSNIEMPHILTENDINKSKDTLESEIITENIETANQDILKSSNEHEYIEKEEITTESLNEESNPKSETPTTESGVTSHSNIDITVSTEHTISEQSNSKNDDIDDSDNEIDLIYKTLYTTYTYLTTFFGDQTSSIASHKSIITNIITSTVDLTNLDPSLLGAFDEHAGTLTSAGVSRPTETLAINSIIDLVKNKDVIESVEGEKYYNTLTPTPSLGDIIPSIKPDSVKTYYTTYTFFTTIYVGSDANVCSRSEVYTNYVGPDELVPTKTNPIPRESTRAQFDFRNCKQIKGLMPQNIDENSSIESSTSSEHNLTEGKEKDLLQPSSIETDMLFSVESNPLVSENSFVTDVKSSSSKGETKLLDNNNVLDDQISSESNIDEILPSPTLLLQTSYTTFTYFTTMYIGKDSSKVKSHLETITNVVTETISPKTESEEENNLPITYYTTFTYWTTLYKDKSTTITSREEIVSNVVTPIIQPLQTVSPIDTTPIDIVSEIPPKDVLATIKPSLLDDNVEQDDGKATFFTTYTYFTTFYAGNTSQIRSSLETVTNIVDSTKIIEDNQLGRKIPTGAIDKNLIQDVKDKSLITPSKVKEDIQATISPKLPSLSPTLLQGTYIDNLFAEIKPLENNKSDPITDKKILFSQVAVISGDSTIITNDNSTFDSKTTTKSTITSTETTPILTPTPDVIESSVADPETTTEYRSDSTEENDEDDSNSRKKSRLTFTTKKPSFTPVIIPFASRNRPTFSPKRQPVPNSATTITRADFTPTITVTPTLKAVRPSSGYGSIRKQSTLSSSSSSGRRFASRSSSNINLSANVPSSRPGSFSKGSIQPTSRRTGFRSTTLRSNGLDFASRSASQRIRPTVSSRLRNSRQSTSIPYQSLDQNESETFATQQEEAITESLDEATENPTRQTTNNPLLKFRRPPVARQPGTAIIPRSTTPASKRPATIRGRATTTTKKVTTTRTTANPLLSLRRQRPNSLFPKRNLFKQPEPEPEEELGEEDEQVRESEELLEEEEEFEDNDYDASNRKEQVATPATPPLRKPGNIVQIRPFAFKRRTKRQVDYGNRKFTNFRRPAVKASSTRRPEPEPETESPPQSVQKQKSARRLSGNSRPTTATAPKVSSRQPFIVRGSESRATTTTAPAYKRSNTRTSSRSSTLSSKPKTPRLSHSPSSRSSSSRPTSRSRSRTTTSRASSRQRSSFENLSGERYNKYDAILDDGKITVTHQIPFEVTVPIVNGKMTEYKNLLTAKPKIETLLLNQVSTSIGPLGNQQLVLAFESTDLADNGATRITKFVLHETPTSTVIFTPTTIRGRKTSYSHILPSTVYNVEPIVQTITPELNANVPLANLLLSQLLLGNQQQAINPLLALQGQGLLPQQPVVQTPITEYKTRTTTYVTTVTDARETVLPITFRGIPILTTIVDPTTNVITATEYFTDTVVTTPTVLAPPPQLNSLLLPLLLQQQQQQQQQQQALSLQTANPLLGLAQSNFNLAPNNLLPNENLNNDIYSNSPKPNILSDLASNEDFSEDIPESIEDTPPPPPQSRKRNKPKAQKSPSVQPASTKLTSVVTLYVSGKHPGEFSTVLSTVVTDDTLTVKKRQAIYYEDVSVSSSILPTIEQLSGSQDDILLESAIGSNSGNYISSSYVESQTETQSLESIVGRLSDHVNYDASPTYVVTLETPSSIHELKQSSVDGNS